MRSRRYTRPLARRSALRISATASDTAASRASSSGPWSAALAASATGCRCDSAPRRRRPAPPAAPRARSAPAAPPRAGGRRRGQAERAARAPRPEHRRWAPDRIAASRSSGASASARAARAPRGGQLVRGCVAAVGHQVAAAVAHAYRVGAAARSPRARMGPPRRRGGRAARRSARGRVGDLGVERAGVAAQLLKPALRLLGRVERLRPDQRGARGGDGRGLGLVETAGLAPLLSQQAPLRAPMVPRTITRSGSPPASPRRR